MRAGVLLLNLGGPASAAEIEPYLARIFSDPEMIRLPVGGTLRLAIARRIAARRAPRVAQRYARIGGGSPLGPETRRQAEALAEVLGVPVTFGMRYTAPSVADAADALRAAGARRMVVIPLYPHYSGTTSGSAVRAFEAHARAQAHAGVQAQGRGGWPFRVIPSHHDDPGYIAALAGGLLRSLERAGSGPRTRVLFSAHSIPLSCVRRGDPYVAQVRETVRLVVREAELDPASTALAFQSRIGPVRWQGPSLDKVLRSAIADRIERIVVIPVSFVAENIETRYDLDIVFRAACREAGIAEFVRVPALGNEPAYIAALARLADAAAQRMATEGPAAAADPMRAAAREETSPPLDGAGGHAGMNGKKTHRG